MTLKRAHTQAVLPAAADAAPRGRAVHVVTFGCQMNKYDSSLVEGRFRARGWRLVGSMPEADVVLFNTCSVREHAEERAYSWIGELKQQKRARPELVIGVMGCLAQRAEEEVFERAAHVDLVVGTRRFHQLPELVDELFERRAAAGPNGRAERVLAVEMDGSVSVERSDEPPPGGPAEGALHAYLTVMRGCDLNCTYCIVPRTRGRVQSRPIDEIAREARWMVARGARVLTLLGQTVNSYGEDLPEPGPGEARGRGRGGRPALADLLYALESIDGLWRVRLITLHPSYVTRELAQALAECSTAEHFLPLPAQSGSDRMLRAMKRGYTLELYRKRIELLREHVPGIELGSDWIVGFPGESEDDFRGSEQLLGEIGFAQGYVFQYSPRPATAAFERADDVPAEIKSERNQRLLAALERSARLRTERALGREERVLVEEVSPRRPEVLRARLRNGLPLAVRAPGHGPGDWLRVRIEEASPYGLGASWLDAPAASSAVLPEDARADRDQQQPARDQRGGPEALTEPAAEAGSREGRREGRQRGGQRER